VCALKTFFTRRHLYLLASYQRCSNSVLSSTKWRRWDKRSAPPSNVQYT
jgi:hypothetical protein